MSENVPPSSGESLRQKILKALDGLVVLHVSTVVGAATIQKADDSGDVSTVKLSDTSQKVGNTVVNTMLGDTTTIYTPDFVTDQALMSAHMDAVRAAHEVRKGTMEMLKTVLKDFEDVLFPKRPAP